MSILIPLMKAGRAASGLTESMIRKASGYTTRTASQARQSVAAEVTRESTLAADMSRKGRHYDAMAERLSNDHATITNSINKNPSEALYDKISQDTGLEFGNRAGYANWTKNDQQMYDAAAKAKVDEHFNIKKGTEKPGITDYAVGHKVPQVAAALLGGSYLVNNLSSSRGQQSNAQLYGQAPLQ